MKLYFFEKKSYLTETQIKELEFCYDEVIYLDKPDFEQVYADKEPKVLALSPEVVGWNIGKDIISKITKLRAICLETTAYEWIDLKYCSSKGIFVTNVPRYSTNSVAEQAMFMALALTKKYPLFVKEGKMNWDSAFLGGDMTSKTAGIIGYGAVGKAIAERCAGFGMDVMFFNRTKKATKYRQEELDYVIKNSDYVFFCLAKNEQTQELLNNRALSKLKPAACAVSMVSGLVDTKYLIKRVEKGTLFGAAFESDNANLKDYPGNVFAVLPNCYYTKDSQKRQFEIWVKTIVSANSFFILNEVYW